MPKLKFLNANGDFVLTDADQAAETYFPLANEGGIISSITPRLAGDCKTGQDTFLLAACSEQTLHESRATRNFWLQFADGTLWSAAGQSAAQQAARFGKGADEVMLYGGLLWQTVERANRALGVKAAVTSFVPAGQDTVELMRVTVTNLGGEALTFTPTAAMPLYGRSADNIRDHRHVTSLLQRLRVERNGVTLTPTLTFDERGHRPGAVHYTVRGQEQDGALPVRFLGTVQAFCGSAGSYDCPAALADSTAQTAWLSPGDTAQGYEMMGVLQFAPVTLRPGQSRSWYLALGIDCTGEEYLTTDTFASALESTKCWWQAQNAAVFAACDPDLTAWMRWVGIQPTLRRICGCSFLPHHDYGRGGRGWRDLWQDSLALLLHDPAAVRGDLVRYFAGVRADGTNATIIGRKPGEFVADRNRIVRVWMDHGYWPLVTTDLYIQQTGDISILLENQPYFCDDRKCRGEHLNDTPAPPQSGTVLEHLIVQNVTAYLDAGRHGCIRLRGADWNDALDMAVENGEGVAFTAAYAGNLYTLADLCRSLQSAGHESILLAGEVAVLLRDAAAVGIDTGARNAVRQRYEAVCEACTEAPQAVPCAEAATLLDSMSECLKSHLCRTEFVTDGAGQRWMNSYYDNNGAQVEGLHAGRVRIMLTGQVFALMSGTAEGEQTQGIVRAVDCYLDSPLRGGVCLNTDFGEIGVIAPTLGRQFGFAYGHKENGAVFCHMAAMYAFALYRQGLPEAGCKVLRELYTQSCSFEIAQIFPGIPEYFDPAGRGMYPYLTGAASWLVYCMLTQCYGVRGQNGDLLLAPQLLADQFDATGTAAVTLRFAGRPITVRYRNPAALGPSEYTATRAELDGKTVQSGPHGLLIPRTMLAGTDPMIINVALMPNLRNEE